MSVIGENIRNLRISKGMSQAALAEKIGETRQTLWKYESGTVTNIPVVKIEALAEALSCDPSELLGWEQEGNVEREIFMEERAPYLTRKEAEMLENFQSLNRENKDKMLLEIKALLEKQQSEEK